MDINQLIRTYRQESENALSEKTYLTMKRNFERIEMIFDKTTQEIELKELDKVEEIVAKIDKNYKLASKIQTILGIKKLIASFENTPQQYSIFIKWVDELKKNVNQRNEKIGNNEMTPNEEKNWIDYEDLKEKFVENLYKTVLDNQYIVNNIVISKAPKLFFELKRKLLLAFYILIPPARIENYQNLLVRHSKNLKKKSSISLNKNYNYLTILENKNYELIFNKYKTSKLLGKVKRIIPKDSELGMLIKNFLFVRRGVVLHNDGFLFSCNESSKKPMTPANFTTFLKKSSKLIFEKELSVNLFRHIFISYISKKSLSINDKKEIALFMGQTYNPTQQEQYRKIKNKDKINFFQ